MGAGQRPGMGGVELAGQVVHEDQPAPLVGGADRGLTGEQGLGLGEELDEVLRSLRHGGSSWLIGTTQR